MGYADRAQKGRENAAGFKPPEGDYQARFSVWEYGKSKAGNAKVTIQAKPTAAPTPAILAEMKEKNRKIKIGFTLSVDFQMDAFLAFLEDAGADLSRCRDEASDPTHQDLRDILEAMEARPPLMDLTVSYPTKVNPQYPNSYNVRITKVEKVLTGAATAPQVPGAPAAPPPPPAAPAPVGVTLEALLGNGWTMEAVAASPEYRHLVPVAPPPPPPAPAYTPPAGYAPPAPPAPAVAAPPAPPAPPAGAPARPWA